VEDRLDAANGVDRGRRSDRPDANPVWCTAAGAAPQQEALTHHLAGAVFEKGRAGLF
jgi:hypothetical protein